MPDSRDLFDRVLSSLAGFVVGRQPLTTTLTHVAELARDGIAAADYAAVTTLRDGTPETTVATDPMMAEIDRAQYEADSGPCLDAFRSGEVLRMDSTEDDERWPDFGRAAAAHGVHSTLSLPLIVAGDGIGALNLYSRRPRAFSTADESEGVRFAEPAAVLLANAYLFWQAHDLAQNLETALASRAVIEQAKGILMGQQGVDAEAAFDLLRRASEGP